MNFNVLAPQALLLMLSFLHYIWAARRGGPYERERKDDALTALGI